MLKAFSPLLRIGICILSYFCATSEVALAQVTTDDTVNTQVTQNNNIAEITGGETRGENLFHSFQDFSVGTGNEAFFNNANDISNIFSRVTGGNISNIDGLIRSNGNASLFLINPAGIIFGENSRLDIGGSFYGSSASGILFEEGEFSAIDLENPPLLTINAPIGLNLRNNSADIVNRSQYEEESQFGLLPVGLKVQKGNSITLEAGNILFQGGLATAPGGNIDLKATGDIEISAGEQIGFQFVNYLDTSSAQGSGGMISLNSATGNVNILNANLSSASIANDSSSNGGNITISAKQSTNISNSLIDSTTNSATGSGEVSISAGSSIRLENLRIDAANFGNGRSGDITITAFDGGSVELIGTQSEQAEIGQDTNNSNLVGDSAAAEIFVDAFGGGDSTDGQTGGNLTIEGGSIKIDNYNLVSRVNEFSDNPFLPNPDTQGNAGDIFILGSSIEIVHSSLVTETLGEGDAGNIELNATEDIVLSNGAEFSTRTVSSGSAGLVNVDANLLTLDSSSIEASNLISELTSEESEVFAGSVNLTLAENVFLLNDSTISAIAEGEANGGNINITANSIVAFPAQETGSDIIASATQGLGGNVNITAESILGIQENDPPVDFSNDINASSNVDGLDGTISITTSNVDALQGTVELASNPLDPNRVATRACSSDDTQFSTLAIRNSMRTPPNLNRPFISENIYIDGKNALEKTTLEDNSLTDEHNRKIVPAQGVVVKENGQIALVAYPTSNKVSPSVYKFINCQNPNK